MGNSLVSLVCSCSDHFPVSDLVYLLAGAFAHFLINPPFPLGISSKLPRDRGSSIPTWPGGLAPRPGFGGGSLLHAQRQSGNATATSPSRVDSQIRGMVRTPDLFLDEHCHPLLSPWVVPSFATPGPALSGLWQSSGGTTHSCKTFYCGSILGDRDTIVV